MFPSFSHSSQLDPFHLSPTTTFPIPAPRAQKRLRLQITTITRTCPPRSRRSAASGTCCWAHANQRRSVRIVTAYSFPEAVRLWWKHCSWIASGLWSNYRSPMASDLQWGGASHFAHVPICPHDCHNLSNQLWFIVAVPSTMGIYAYVPHAPRVTFITRPP